MDVRVKTFNELGLNAFSNGQLKLALEYFEETLGLDPDNTDGLLNKAKVLKKKGEMVAAVSTLDTLLGGSPDHTEGKKLRNDCLRIIREGLPDEGGMEGEEEREEMEVDTSGAEPLLEEMEEILGGEEESEIMGGGGEDKGVGVVLEEINEDQGGATEETRRKAMKKSEEVILKVERAKRKGMPIEEIESQLDEISSFINRGDYGRALSHAEDCLEALAAIAEKYDRAQRLKKRLKQNVRDMRTQGMDIPDSEGFFDDIDPLLAEGRYREAVANSLDHLFDLTYRKVKHQEALDSIKEGWQAIKEAEMAEEEKEKAEELLSKARSALIQGMYEEAQEHAQGCREAVLDSLATKRSFEERIGPLKDTLHDYERLGMKVTELRSDLSDIEEDVREDFSAEEASDRLSRFRDRLDEATEAHDRGIVLYHITEYKVGQARDHGVDTRGMEQSLNTLLQELHKGNYENVSHIADEVQSFVEDSRAQQKRSRAMKAIGDAEDLFKDCRDLGIDMRNSIKTLKESKLSFNRGEFVRSREKGNNAINKFTELKVCFLMDDTNSMLEEMENKEEFEDDRKEVERLVEAKLYHDALSILASLRKPLFEERAKNQIIETQERLGEVVSASDQLKKGWDLFERAQKEFRNEEFEAAFRMGREAAEAAENAKMYSELLDDLKAARARIDELEEKGVDVSEAKRQLSMAKPALDKKFYQTALDHTEISRELAREAEAKFGYRIRITDLASRLNALREVTGDLGDIREDLEEAEEMIKGADKEELGSFLDHIEGGIAELEEEFAVKRSKKAKFLKKKGNSFFKKGDVQAAMSLFDRALKLKGDDETIVHNKGVVFRELGRSREALECAEKALAINPDYQPSAKLKRLCEKELRGSQGLFTV